MLIKTTIRTNVTETLGEFRYPEIKAG